MIIFDVFFCKIHICNYDDQGVDAKSISSKSEFTWIHFVNLFQLTFKIITEKLIQQKSVFWKIWVYFEPLR